MNARALRTGLATLLICVIAGCSTGPLRDDPPDAAPAVDPPSAETGTPGLIYVDPRADVDEPETEERTFESYPGTGEFFDREAAGRTPAPDVDDGEIIFNFEGESLSEVVKAILGDLLQENYVIGPNLQGNVTFSTSKPVPMSQVMPILEMLLSWNNATLVYKDGRYHVLPINRAIQGQLRPVIGPSQGQRGYEVRAFPLEYISPSEMEKLLRPYAKETAFINVDNLRGLLILGGTRQELQNYEETIGIFDVDWLSGMSVGIYPLERVEVETVVTELESVFGEGAGTPLAGMFRFLAIERLNAVMVITPQPEYLDTAAEWVERLDRGGSEAGVRLYVYEVKNVKATDLADTLNQVFGEGSNRSSGRDRNRSNQLAPGLEAGEITSINDPRSRVVEERAQEIADQVTGGAVSAGGDGDGLALVAGEEIRITAVEESNSLLIRATPAQYEAVLGAIRRLDTVPLQVLIEVKVLEVTLTNNLRYGVSWFFENGIPEVSPAGGAGVAVNKRIFGSDPERGGSLSDSGLNYSITGTDVAIVVEALESQTDVSTISAPSMMVLNNREANINVGTQIPVNSPIFNTGTGNNIGQSRVQFRDTGVTLNVTPRVNPGGMVFMEVQQEVSFPIPGTGDSNGNVAVSQRRVDTEVAVQSGETVALGGLIQANLSETAAGLPFLAAIPVVGGLFGTQTDEVTRTELLVLITPKVVTSVEEARQVSEEYRSKMRGLIPFDLQQINVDKNQD